MWWGSWIFHATVGGGQKTSGHSGGGLWLGKSFAVLTSTARSACPLFSLAGQEAGKVELCEVYSASQNQWAPELAGLPRRVIDKNKTKNKSNSTQVSSNSILGKMKGGGGDKGKVEAAEALNSTSRQKESQGKWACAVLTVGLMSCQVHSELSRSDLMDHKATKAVSPFTQGTIIYVIACFLMYRLESNEH